ncbi:MAG TPA: 2Fe-2S iron-sulfur cluster-binding protein, partial [Deltaproteobacteria bacterium]|nr:2Fe-2S iron-sulfur cluster-binding protein [Deltaproteobacteria bacterium]
MREYTVTLVPSGRSRPFPEGTILSDALVDMGVPLRTPCGGRGLCRRCRVRLGDDASTEVLA